ncbi:MAG: hypothetical protein ACR2RA_19335 [Geminicoccaceae bacterium]
MSPNSAFGDRGIGSEGHAMIDTLFFLLQIVGFLVLIGWAVVHDRISADGQTSGPLAYKPSSAGSGHSGTAHPRIGLTRHSGDANLKGRRR